MRYLITFLFLISSLTLYGEQQEYTRKAKMHHPKGMWREYDFNVHKRFYSFSTEFEIEYEGHQFAYAVKSMFHLRTQYDLYDTKGELVALGVHSLFPSYGLGWFYPWAADMYVYGKKGEYLGMIDGTLYTEASAKFNFYDQDNKCIAVAYMDRGLDAFVITDPNYTSKKIAELTRHNNRFQIDFWTVQVFHEDVISPEMLQIFSIFACDKQSQFLEDD